MQEQPTASAEPSPAKLLYARVLQAGMYAGLGCLFVTFALYVFGIVDPHIAHEDLSEHWGKPIHEYLADTGIETGWSWVTMLRYGDFLNFVGIAVLAGVTIVCYLAIVPVLLRKKDFVYAALAMTEVLVLVAAASGIIAVGH